MRFEHSGVELFCSPYQEVLPSIKSGSVGLLLTDPPYGCTAAPWDKRVDLAEFWSLSRRVLAAGAPAVVFGVEPFSSAVRMSNPKAFKYDWIWVKTEKTGHLNAKKMPLRAHEVISVFGKGRVNYFPQMTEGQVIKRSKKERDRSELYGRRDKVVEYNSTSRYPTSVLHFAKHRQTSKRHPTQKPVDLLRYLIRTYTRPGDLVLDPFFGSGSTALACALEGRRFVGAELHRPFFDTAREWITTYDGLA